MGSEAKHSAFRNSVNWNTNVQEVNRSADAVERHRCDLVCNPLPNWQPVECVTKYWNDVFR